MSAIPSNNRAFSVRSMNQTLVWFVAAMATTASAPPFAPWRATVDKRCCLHHQPAATAGVTTRHGYRLSRNCGKKLQMGEVFGEISRSVLRDCSPALGASLRCGGVEEAIQTSLTKGMTAAKDT
jgi:hypothetical protein